VVKEEDVPTAYFFQYKTYIQPGNYTVRVSFGGYTGKQDLTVLEAKKYE
jgi:hypothetical protein